MGLEKLPIELIDLVLDFVRGSDEQSPNGGLLEAACVSLKFRDSAVAKLRKDVAFISSCRLMIRLLYRLFKDEDFAQSVRSVSCSLARDNTDGEHHLRIREFDLIPYIHETLTQRYPVSVMEDDRESKIIAFPTVDLASLVTIEYQVEAIFCAITLSCQNLRRICFPRKFEDVEEDSGLGSFFNSPFMDWPYLESVHLKVAPGTDGFMSFIGAQLTEHLFHPNRRSLKHFRCDQLGTYQILIYLKKRAKNRFSLSELTLSGLEGAPDDDWDPLISIMHRCQGLEILRLKFKMINVINAYNDARKLHGALETLNKTLRIIEIESLSTGYATNEGDPSNQDGNVITLPKPILWNRFEVLTELSVPMPFIFGEGFVIDAVGPLVKRGTSTWMSQSIVDEYKYTLVDNLPSSLRTLKLLVSGRFEHQTLACALSGLLARRKRNLPNLRCIHINSRLAYHFDLFFDVSDSDDFREAQKDGLSIVVAACCYAVDGTEVYYEQHDLF